MTGAARAGLVLRDRKIFVTYITASLGNNPYFVLLSEPFTFAYEGEGESKHPYYNRIVMRKRKSYFVYIMGSLSGTLYIGVTGNLHKRAFEHKFHRTEGFTDRYDAERLLYWESYDDVHKAIAREKQLKGWRRAKKIALIESVNLHWLDLAKEWYPWMKTCGDGRDASTP
jgi:putative endonuclease